MKSFFKLTFYTALFTALLVIKPFSYAGSELPANLKDKAFLVMTIEKAESYQNEKIMLDIKLFTEGLSVRDIHYPQFFHEGLSAGEFSNPVHGSETINGIPYTTVEFRTHISGSRPGRFMLGPAHLQLTILSHSSDRLNAFFGGQESQTVHLKSGETALNIVPFPETGRPADFKGAVGSFDMTVEVHPRETETGNPVTVKMIIKGKGSFNTVKCPEIGAIDGFRVYKPQAVQKGGVKICEQVLLPISETVKEIPVVDFSFFDPEKKSYRTLTRGPIAIHVKKSDNKKTEDFAAATTPFADRPLQKQRSRGQLHKNYLLLSLCALLLLFLLTPRKQKERIGNTVRAYRKRLDTAKQLRSKLKTAQQLMHTGDAPEFYTEVFRTLQWQLGDTLNIQPAGITADIVDKALMSKGVDGDTLKKIKTVFEQCDMVRYTHLQSDRQEMEATLDMLRNITDHLKKRLRTKV